MSRILYGSSILCINHDFCTEQLNVRYAEPNGLSANAPPLLSLTQN